MGTEEERTCLMCMEVMDLTDQHFKPCKCGYEICVWCWHNIIQIAEKDDTVGRCPACRSAYDKERILKMTISSERLTELSSLKKQKCKDIKQPAKSNPEKQEKMQTKCKETRPAEVNIEKKQNLPNAKLRTLEARNDLVDVRVVQRHLVYIAGLPVSLANEEIVRRKEFLGQYGNIKRIDICRTAESAKYFPSTCVVFVTFSKEEEALRCIQSVNGYILDGYPLKASFGATGYCKSWLKNMRCANQDCFFLHHRARQEDICNRNEVTSACVSKLQQCSGIVVNNSKRNAGKCLPPPVENCSRSNITTSKPLVSVVKSPVVDVKNTLQNCDTRRSDVLRAATSCDLRNTPQGPSNYPSMSNTSVMSAAGREVHIRAQAPDISKSFSTSRIDSSVTGRTDVCSALQREMSGKELVMSHSAPSGCGRQDLKLQCIEYCFENPFSEHNVVQDFGLLGNVKGDLREDTTLNNKAISNSKEDSFTSDILRLNLGLVEPHRLAKQCGASNKKDECLKNSGYHMFSNRMGNSDTGREQLLSSNSNVLDQRKISDYINSFGKTAVDTNRSLGLTAYTNYNCEVPQKDNIILATSDLKEFQLASSVHHSAFPVPKSLLCPPPRYPPGFHPRHAGDHDQPFSVSATCDSTGQYKFPGHPPCVTSQTLSRSNYNIGSELHNSAKVPFGREKLQQTGLGSCNWGSNVVNYDEIDGRHQFRSTFENLAQESMISTDQGTEKPVVNIPNQEAMKDVRGQRKPCKVESSVLAASCVIGVSSSGTAITNHEAPGLQQEFPRPFNDPKSESSNFSYFYYS